LGGVFLSKIVLFAQNQTFWPHQNFLAPPNFWAGYATAPMHTCLQSCYATLGATGTKTSLLLTAHSIE